MSDESTNCNEDKNGIIKGSEILWEFVILFNDKGFPTLLQ